MTQPPTEAAADPLFRRLVSVATSLAIGGMLASVGAVELGAHGKLDFHWSWAVPPLLVVGLVLGNVFWRLLWRAQSENTPASHRNLRRFAILLALIAVGSFAYPIRFIQAERRREVFIGLGLAITVLSGFGVVIYKTIRWMNENEPKDGESEPPEE